MKNDTMQQSCKLYKLARLAPQGWIQIESWLGTKQQVLYIDGVSTKQTKNSVQPLEHPVIGIGTFRQHN